MLALKRPIPSLIIRSCSSISLRTSTSCRKTYTFSMAQPLISTKNPLGGHRFRGLLPLKAAPFSNLLLTSPRSYEAAIARHGPIDLFLAGVGTTGHVAFNEPFSSPASRTRPVALAPATRAANARFFGDDPAAVPARALTVGLGTVLEAHEIVVVATGRAKAAAVREAVEGAVSARWPVTWLQGHGRCTLAVDAEAGGELSRGTVEVSLREVGMVRKLIPSSTLSSWSKLRASLASQISRTVYPRSFRGAATVSEVPREALRVNGTLCSRKN